MFNPKARRISLHNSLDALAPTRSAARKNGSLASAENRMQAGFPAANHTAETMLDALLTALNTRDTEPEGHLERVTAYTIELADRLNLSEIGTVSH